MGYTNREVFSSSPLALVAAEVRFSDSPRLRQQETVDAISVALETMLPVQEQFEQQGIEVRPGEAPRVSMTSRRTFRNTSSTAVASIASDRLSLETTTYSHFAEFREQLLACCRALIEAGVTPAIRRIGLRYIDEIRVPGRPITALSDWAEWIDPRLLAQLTLGPEGASPLRAEGFISFQLSEAHGLNFRYAALARGAVVSPTTIVRPPFDQELPVFVLDLDGYQDFTAPGATLLSVDAVARTLDTVHDPAGATFQASITDSARNLFRRSEG